MSFYDSMRLIVNIILCIIVIGTIIWFLREKKSRRLNKRLGKYTVESIDDDGESLFDILLKKYYNIQNSLIKVLYKSKFMQNYAKHYEKYIDTGTKNKDPMHYIASKFICVFIAIILVIINNVFQDSFFNPMELFLGIIIGFFIPDLFLMGREKVHSKQLENDLLKAITIMNNSFKSGRSITQTIEVVSQELEGPLKKEFELMLKDLNYGLEIEVVFNRFSNRVKLDEVKYLAASLSILNKTGGNIITVFSSIEKNVFSNRKLNEELKNLTASAKFLYRVLTIIPPLFALIIYFMDSTYFLPLINNNLGIIILIIIVVLYVIYIIIIKKIVKLKEY